MSYVRCQNLGLTQVLSTRCVYSVHRETQETARQGFVQAWIPQHAVRGNTGIAYVAHVEKASMSSGLCHPGRIVANVSYPRLYALCHFSWGPNDALPCGSHAKRLTHAPCNSLERLQSNVAISTQHRFLFPSQHNT